MFQRRDDQSEKERFWKKTEEELGEHVRVFALTRCLSGCVEGDGSLWGVLFFTESALFFRHFEQRNWFSALTTAVAGGSREPAEVYFRVPRSEIRSAAIEQQGNRFSRLFSYRPPILTVQHGTEGAVSKELRFTLDTNPAEVAGELQIETAP